MISETLSIETLNEEAAIVTFSAHKVEQENNVITLYDSQDTPAVRITLLSGTKHRVIHTS